MDKKTRCMHTLPPRVYTHILLICVYFRSKYTQIKSIGMEKDVSGKLKGKTGWGSFSALISEKNRH